jgi:uncharacterized protein (DUF305 family)
MKSASTLLALGVLVSPAVALAQQSNAPATVVQPGAPGQASRVLPNGSAAFATKGPSKDDISFMQGMIMHHSQAVEMTDLMTTRSRNPRLLALGKRISISQADEIDYMKQWLGDRGAPVSMSPGMDHMADMKNMPADHMSHMNMSAMPLMPGMLTPEQMKALADSTGPAFDHLFLTGMIQHHTGALTMVQELFDNPGAGQDPVLFDFATDIDNTQRAEIEIMQDMLREGK